ncbi:type IV secretion system DNA-binding domain-containing protein [Patescibacteria group bacterium]|nr:type IV secretion system DNA-binding domain-containing protein [Patescibacteria group bacterium]MBU1868350.1 type IV secretion system DNA-binding domain-containing protein [Patescibacteria group bacterium]
MFQEIILQIILVLFLISGLIAGISYLVFWVKFRNREKVSLTLKFLEVQMPKENEIEIAVAEQLFTTLSALTKGKGLLSSEPGISFEILGEYESIRFIIAVPYDFATYVEEQLHAVYPEAQVKEIEEYNIFSRKGKVAFAELKLGGPQYYPLRGYEDLATDPLNQLTTGLSKLGEGEAAVIQVIVTPAGDRWRIRGQNFVAVSNMPPKEGQYKPKVDTKVLEAVSNKCSKVGFNTTIRIVTVGQDQIAAQRYLSEIRNSFSQFGQPHLASLATKKIWLPKNFMLSFLYRYPVRLGRKSILNAEELATIIHFPNGNVKTPHIKWLLTRTSEAPQGLPQTGLYLGKSIFRGRERNIFMQTDDRRRHMYVIGQTGTGKTQFLKFLAQQDIKNGRGLAFVDPHGEDVEDLLNMVPKERAEDVVYFNPGDTERPLGLNILDVEGEGEKHKVVNSFIALLYKIYDPNRTGMMGAVLERAIRNVMLTAMSERGNSLVEVLRLLIDPDFAKTKIPLIEDPLVKQFWTKEMAQTTDFHKSEKLGYFISKFDRFVTEKLMRNIVGQSQSAFNFREIMDSQKILLVNLAKGLIGEENSQFLGLMIVPQILAAAMSRADMPQEERKDFFLYVDEFQNFATDDFAEILAEARKFRLNLQVANQYISQIDEKIKDAVFGNVGTLVSFRIGVDDATYLENQFEPVFAKNDLLNLPVGRCFLKLLMEGQPTKPFSMTTDWPAMCAAERNEELGAMIKELSRTRYGKDRAWVEQDVMVRSGLEG